jgi:hypothetical protein
MMSTPLVWLELVSDRFVRDFSCFAGAFRIGSQILAESLIAAVQLERRFGFIGTPGQDRGLWGCRGEAG